MLRLPNFSTDRKLKANRACGGCCDTREKTALAQLPEIGAEPPAMEALGTCTVHTAWMESTALDSG